ncbi:Zinc finger homeobox protein [Dirofilaria immitis]
MNHMRESGTAGMSLSASTALCRISSAKSAVQVRCRACQEILSCPLALREHCESRAHSIRIAQLTSMSNEAGSIPGNSSAPTAAISMSPSPETVLECRHCSFETTDTTDAIEHMQQHPPNMESTGAEHESLNLEFCCGTIDEDEAKNYAEENFNMNEATYCCPHCNFITKTKTEFSEHRRVVHSSKTNDESTMAELCPLCPCKYIELRTHLTEEHKIAEEAIERLLLNTAPSSLLSDSAFNKSLKKKTDRQIYRYHCSQCSLAFRTEQRLANHTLHHTFRATTRCTKCDQNFRSHELLKKHNAQEHTLGKTYSSPTTSSYHSQLAEANIDDRMEINHVDLLRPFKCELCKENFEQKHQLLTHYNSVTHLHKAKKMLEEQSNNFQPSTQILAALQASTNSQSLQGSSKPFKCNLCKLGYGQGSTLDIHIRSVAHQSRLTKIAELLAQGEIDGCKSIVEQPSGPAQTILSELATKSDSTSDSLQNGLEQQQQSTLAMINMLNMAQLLSIASVGQTALPSDIPAATASQAQTALASIAAGFPPIIAPFGTLRQLPISTDDAATMTTKAINEQSVTSIDDERTPRTSASFRKMLETYGFDLVMQYNESLEQPGRKLDIIPDETIPDLSHVECTKCNKVFSSIWILKAHYEEVHENTVPTIEIEKFAKRLHETVDESEEKENDESDLSVEQQNVTVPVITSVSVSGSKKRTLGKDELPLSSSHGAELNTDQGCLFTQAEAASARNEDDKYILEVKKLKENTRSTSATPRPSTSKDSPDLNNQLAMMSMLGYPFMPNPFIPLIPPDFFTNPLFSVAQNAGTTAPHAIPSASPAKRARTRITDDQLKILRQYFDINNSPSEQQIKEMSVKAQLPEKVIKHWFRNTLFKERQRDKDSPYNFNIPPQMSIDLDTYEKTGETKITTLKVETEEESKSQLLQASENPVNISSVGNSVSTANVQTAQIHSTPTTCNNPFATFLHDERNLSSILPNLPSSNSVTGRRANRTRFTDYQLRTLQQFFDKQAYPKDDDLEILSKKLQLSPRVIVVWFQNARQKARKIYENQPVSSSDDRFMKTPGSNFQCKRCQLVFQRYYELIQHQQKFCYKDDCVAQQKDNKAVEENLSEDEKTNLENLRDVSRLNSTSIGTTNQAVTLGGALAQLIGTVSSGTATDISQTEFLKLQVPVKLQDPSMKLKVRDKKKAIFYKRCPFCCLLFHSRDSLIVHISNRHPEQANSTSINVDSLPDAEDVPTITALASDDSLGDVLRTNGGSKKSELSPLDLSYTTNGDGREDSVSISPSFVHSDNDDNNSDNMDISERYNSASPNATGISCFSAQRSPASSKRYRTHLTPLQVHVMKSIFMSYKTPSMNECDLLGTEIGLHKRVVQVWFQNARAKERKSRSCSGDDELLRCSSTCCAICGVSYDHLVTLHDHIFTNDHINRVKKLLQADNIQAEGSIDLNAAPEMTDKDDIQRTRMKAIRDRRTMKASCVSTSNPGSNAIPHFPYNFLYSIRSGLAPIMYDPNLMGTPIPMLQIPESVMTQITMDMNSGRESSKFTQDGKTFQQLVAVLPLRDFQCAGSIDSEVGWACPQCTNVFQQEQLLKNHQRLICQGCDSVFKLVQTHYQCRACNTKFGAQTEFRVHCDTLEHQAAREVFLGRTA